MLAHLPLSQSVKVLRRVDDLSQGAIFYLLDEYSRRKKSIDPDTQRLRADVIDPRTGWVDNDLPRDEPVTQELMERTTGFAIADPFGRIQKEFSTFAAADKARRSARVVYDVQTEVEEDIEEGNGELAGENRRARSVLPYNPDRN